MTAMPIGCVRSRSSFTKIVGLKRLVSPGMVPLRSSGTQTRSTNA